MPYSLLYLILVLKEQQELCGISLEGDLTLTEVNAAAEVIYDLVDPGANLIFGSVIDPSYTGQVSITLIATGFKRQEESEGRPAQAGGDGNRGRGGSRFSSPSQDEGPKLQIPEFLQRKGRSGFSRG
ncbi:hypothetical protein ZWY2020_044157 [Hordeum vulgare]|nr:hypothetical protein ZWY2020_044157 [Hordeum vulgare]